MLRGSVAELCGLPNLTHVSLKACARVTDAALPSLASLTRLRELSLHACAGVGDAGLVALGPAAGGLTALCLRECQGFGETGMRALTALPRLKRLDLGYCKVVFRSWTLVTPEIDSFNLVGTLGCGSSAWTWATA